MGRGIGKVFLIHFFLITHQSNYLVFILGTSSMLHLMVLCTCTNALSKTEITTLTSQNSPSSYNASSLKGSKNGCLTMTPVKKLPSTFLFKISHDKRVRERYISLKINRLSALWKMSNKVWMWEQSICVTLLFFKISPDAEYSVWICLTWLHETDIYTTREKFLSCCYCTQDSIFQQVRIISLFSS